MSSELKYLLFYKNENVVEWLRKSYFEKGAKSNIEWAIQPQTCIYLSLRLFFISLKTIFPFLAKSPNVKIESNEENSTLSSNTHQSFVPNIYNPKRGIVDFLLYRNLSNHSSFLPYTLVDTENNIIEFGQAKQPIASIIVPVYNNIAYTLACLKSLTKNISQSIPYEVIVVDDGSTDDTEQVIKKINHVRYHKNAKNIGFVGSCNLGAELATGTYLVFLNNDTQIQENWLESMLTLFESNDKIGIVGSKLVYPDGRLQEAGGIIWNDANAANFGNLGNPFNPIYLSQREVDYVSGASLMISKNDFIKLGGFNSDFAPGYYEDTDLCMSVRYVLGKKVIYQPQSIVIHYEGISSGKDIKTGMKQYQEVNKTKFLAKWSSKLKEHHLPYGSSLYQSANRLNGKKTILLVDYYMPRHDKESGSRRLFYLINILKEIELNVVFIPDDYHPAEPYFTQLQKLGVTVLHNNKYFSEDASQQLSKLLSEIDIAWVCRPDLCEKYVKGILATKNSIKIVYDTIDLHFLRQQRELEFYPDIKHTISWQEMKRLEMKWANKSDIVIAITEFDKSVFVENNISPEKIAVIPNVHEYKGTDIAYSNREGILFIGSYDHPPNIDAALWLCNEIMPLVWQLLPSIKVTLLGNNPKPEIMKLANENVTVPGFVEDVSTYFEHNKIFVAPLRFGAGIKGKIGHSLEYGLPVISTSIGTEGMGLRADYNVLVADNPKAFAQKIIEIYTDSTTWESLASKSEEAIYSFSPESIKKTTQKMIKKLM